MRKICVKNPQKRQSEKKTWPILKKAVKEQGGLCIKLSPATFIGIPDGLVLFKGKAKFVETKSQGDKPRKAQRLAHFKIRAMGFEVWVVDVRELIPTFLNSF
jgi:hypothetical protein